MSVGDDAGNASRLSLPEPQAPAVGAIAARHLRELARQPRPAGSVEAQDARKYCSRTLSSMGYQVTERPFAYSAAVGSYGTPAGGLAALLVVIAAAAFALGSRPGVALATMLVGFACLALGGRWVAVHGVLTFPLMPRYGVNVEACRNAAEPELWLVAHVDSKSQPVPLLVRAAGIIVLALAALAAVALAVAGLLGAHPKAGWIVTIAAAVLGALPVLGSVVGHASAGAIDNASGVATILCVAEWIPPDAPVGVLITDAEELGLAGARAWCAETRHRRVPVLNCDGVDDGGELTLMWTRPRARRLEQAVRATARRLKLDLRVIPLVPGVLVDGVAFSDAGWETVTLSRGSLATLRRIHTRADNLTYLEGKGIVDATLLLGGTVLQLMGL